MDKSRINNYKKKLRKYYLEPGRQQSELLRNLQPRELSRPDSRGNLRVRMPSGIELVLSQEEYLSRPEVFIQTLVEDFWKLYELALTQLENPTVVMTLRTLYEQCYKKVLHYSNSTPAQQSKLAKKSWAITSALMVRRASDLSFSDAEQDAQFQRWIDLLPEPDKSHYQRIKDENFSSGAITIEINKLYPGLYKVLTDNEADLVLADGTPSNNAEGLVIISNGLSGYVHGNTANVSDMTNDLVNKQHVYRSRTILCTTAFQLMTIVNNKWLNTSPFSLNEQKTYFRRMSPHVIRRLSR